MNPFPKNTAKLDQEAQQQEQLMQFLKSNPELMKKYQEELTKMQGQNKKELIQPMTSKQYVQKVQNETIGQCLDEQGGLVIIPDKGMVLKFFDKKSGEKIFVNVVKHAGVDHPEEKVLIDLQNQSGLRIPMSMGRVREDSDKKGLPCKVIDVVMNDKIVETADKNSDIFLFMAQIISNYLLQKHKISVAEDQVVKVNAKYKGNSVEVQRIRARKNPKIEEVRPTKTKEQFQDEEKLLNELSGDTGKKEQKPQFRVFGVNAENEREEYSLQSRGKVKTLEIECDLSLLIHSRGIHLQGSDRIVYLFVRGLYQLCLRLPQSIRNYHAVFARKERKLKLICEVQSEKVQADRVKSKQVDIKIQNDMLDELV